MTVKEFKIKIAPWIGWLKSSNSKHITKKLIKKEYYDNIL